MAPIKAGSEPPRSTVHRDGFAGVSITPSGYRNLQGHMRYDGTTNDPGGRIVRRYAKLTKATLTCERPLFDRQRIRAEWKG